MATKSTDEHESREASSRREEGAGTAGGTSAGGTSAGGTSAGGTSAGEPMTLDRADPAFLSNAYALYAELRAKGPVVRAPVASIFALGEAQERAAHGSAEKGAFFVTRYDEAAAALIDERLSSDPFVGLPPEHRPPMPQELRPIARSLLVRDPPDHTRLRRLVQPSFNARAMEALRPRIQQIAEDLLDKAERAAAERGESAPDRRMDLLQAFAYPIPIKVISDMLGIPLEDRETVNVWAEEFLREGRHTPATRDAARATLQAFERYLVDLFERRRRAPTDDMISQLVHATEEGDTLDEGELRSMVLILYFAGYVTTVNLIGNGVVALLTHPGELARFRADPALVKGVVEETLRYWGPVDFPSNQRTAREDLELYGTRIPKGSRVTVGLASANRDPERFTDPDTFDITRPDASRHIAFGRGIHLCIGAPLARIEGEVAFETLFRRLPGLRLAVPAEELRWSGAGMRGFRRVPVSF